MSYSNYEWMTDEEVVREVESWEESTPMEQELAARLDQAIQEIAKMEYELDVEETYDR